MREVRENFESGGNTNANTVDEELIACALNVCQKRVRDLDELIDDPTAFGALVSDQEWDILRADELTQEALALKKHENWIKKNEPKVAQKTKKKKKRVAKKTTEVDVNGDDVYGIEDNEEESDENEKFDLKDRKIA
jgi:hypothetical protein